MPEDVPAANVWKGIYILEETINEWVGPLIRQGFPDGVPDRFLNRSGRFEFSEALKYVYDLRQSQHPPFRDKRIFHLAHSLRERRNDAAHGAMHTFEEAERALGDMSLFAKILGDDMRAARLLEMSVELQAAANQEKKAFLLSTGENAGAPRVVRPNASGIPPAARGPLADGAGATRDLTEIVSVPASVRKFMENASVSEPTDAKVEAEPSAATEPVGLSDEKKRQRKAEGVISVRVRAEFMEQPLTFVSRMLQDVTMPILTSWCREIWLASTSEARASSEAMKGRLEYGVLLEDADGFHRAAVTLIPFSADKRVHCLDHDFLGYLRLKHASFETAKALVECERLELQGKPRAAAAARARWYARERAKLPKSRFDRILGPHPALKDFPLNLQMNVTMTFTPYQEAAEGPYESLVMIMADALGGRHASLCAGYNWRAAALSFRS